MKRRKIVLGDADRNAIAFRFWTQTIRVGNCLEWLLSCDKEGYGKFSIFHSSFRAHRVAYYLYYGIDPGDLVVRHRCDNTRCVNPHHLRLGTQLDNMHDMDSRNRRGKVYLKGEMSGRSILSSGDVREIRASKKSNRQLARELGVSPSCIDHAKRGLNWKHIK